MSTFKLSKWYLDSISDAGETTIAYTGSAQWGKVRLHYSSVLETTGTRVLQRTSLRRHAEPERSGPLLAWGSKILGVDGSWKTSAQAVRAEVYRSPSGSIDWNCVMPMAQTRIHTRLGLGYAEHLTMTIPPWKLPIRVLRWGRFISESVWVTWIDWLGHEFSNRIVFLNGERIHHSEIADDGLELSGRTRLLLDRSLVLRDGPLGTTALSVIPGIGNMFPSRLLAVTECKWRSRARLERDGESPVHGWAIHEKVSWPE